MNEMYQQNAASGAQNGGGAYLDRLTDSEEDVRDVAKEEDRRLAPKDKKQIAILAAMDIAVFLFIAVWLLFRGGDEFKRIRENAAFDPAKDYYNAASTFESLSPTLRETVYPEGIEASMMSLYSLNNDTVGWLRIPGTGIDHVVVQAKDNDAYLHANFFKQPDQRTRLFFGDYRNVFSRNLQEYSKVTIIYGHHLSADTRIFAELENYMDVEYYKAHPTLEFQTLYGKTVWKVFGCFISAVDSKTEPIFYYWNPEVSDADTAAFCSEVLTRSGFINPAVNLASTDKLLCLSTCTYQIKDDRDSRCVVMARLLRSGENPEVDVSGAYENVNRRMPHAWYTQNGRSDPYLNAPVFGAN